MFKRTLISFTLAALSAASAATFPINLIQPTVVNGKELKAGDYQLEVKDNSVVIVKGKKPQTEVPVKIENTNTKYERTQVLYGDSNGKFSIKQIELGGTSTKLTFQ
jgi:predicted RNA-binding protein with TRAM domain